MHGQDFRTLINTLETVDKKLNIAEAWHKWAEFVNEAGTQSKTKTKTKPKVDNKIFQGTVDTQVQSTKRSEPVVAPTASTRKHSKKKATLNKAVPMPDLNRIKQKMGKSDMDDDWGDLEINAPQLAHEPTLSLGQDDDINTTDIAINAPANAQTTEIVQRIHDVEWNRLIELDTMSLGVVRNLGRRVFNAFGEQDVKDIDYLTTLVDGHEESMDIVSGLVRQFGVPVLRDAVVDFQDTIPGYKAHAGVWAFGTQYYMFVKDGHGEYIYTWDNTETNNLQHFAPQSSKQDSPRLEGVNESFNNNALEHVSYKGYTYDPEIEEDDDSRKLIHHITDPHGTTANTPDWFQQLSAYDYVTADEFKRAVDEINGN